MAVANQLPNGFVVLLLSPREAVMLHDQILDPERFPWQNDESEMIGMEVKRVLYGLVARDAENRLATISHQLMQQAQGEEDDGE